jgi:hypothetical protein
VLGFPDVIYNHPFPPTIFGEVGVGSHGFKTRHKSDLGFEFTEREGEEALWRDKEDKQ